MQKSPVRHSIDHSHGLSSFLTAANRIRGGEFLKRTFLPRLVLKMVE